ncbi:alanine racemase [Microvirga sp. M2]|uniref:alanine racemase n=1 Tax=Microvirga sp. M2 TaxID=3073270 RepID=UPI0039C41863
MLRLKEAQAAGCAHPPAEEPVARARLTVDLDAIARNFAAVRGALSQGAASAVVKRDAYGLGLVPVVRSLAAAGCRVFWVETFEEGLSVRQAVAGARVFVLQGLAGRRPQDFVEARLIPALGTAEEIALSAQAAPRMSVAINLDTGLGRMGVLPDAFREIAAGSGLKSLDVAVLMSHLAGFSEPDRDGNRSQLALFQELSALVPDALPSIATSSFVYAGPRWHIGLARVGSALYGVHSARIAGYRSEPVIALDAPVLSVQGLRAGSRLGYRGDRINEPRRIATIALGYADGLPEAFTDRCSAFVNNRRAAFVGDAAMTTTCVDVTGLADTGIRPRQCVEIVGPNQDINVLSGALGINANRLLVAFGLSTHRTYRGGGSHG